MPKSKGQVRVIKNGMKGRKDTALSIKNKMQMAKD